MNIILWILKPYELETTEKNHSEKFTLLPQEIMQKSPKSIMLV